MVGLCAGLSQAVTHSEYVRTWHDVLAHHITTALTYL